MIDKNHGVHLNPLTSNDMETLRNWRNNPKIYSWCRQTDLISDINQSKWFQSISNDPSIKMFMISHGINDLGVCGLTSIDYISRRAEFSLYISPEHQKKGYAKKALKTLLATGFENYNLNLIWGESFDKNPAIELFESLGMQYEGTRRQFYFKNGKYLDAHLYSITASEYEVQSWKS